MTYGEDLYHDIMTLIQDCRECKRGYCETWCQEFVDEQVKELCQWVKTGHYEEERWSR